MTIMLTATVMRGLLPRAPAIVIHAFVARQNVLSEAGINTSRTRMAFFFANLDHESGGFGIPGLTENIRYTAARMAQVWPNRFRGAADVRARYGTAAGWQTKAFDDIYGSRMGNRPGTTDGSTYIGRGGPQWTGRDGYAALERLTGLPAVSDPAMVARPDLQPEICAAFWTWKRLNACADAGDFLGCVKRWNGGTNGLADRRARLAAWQAALRDLPVMDDAPPLAPPSPAAKPSTVASLVAALVAAFRRS